MKINKKNLKWNAKVWKLYTALFWNTPRAEHKTVFVKDKNGDFGPHYVASITQNIYDIFLYNDVFLQ